MTRGSRSRSATPAKPTNTDDRNRVEFGFARSLGQDSFFSVDEIEKEPPPFAPVKNPG